MNEINTRYSELAELDVYKLFLGATWERMDSDERLAALQELEIRMARRMGRTPRPVLRMKSEPADGYVCMGCFTPGRKTISINELFLTPNPIYGDGFSAAKAIDTIIHEGRHAYQHEMTEDESRLDDPEIMKWRANQIAYIRGEGIIGIPRSAQQAMYAFQPIERDARQFAAQEFRRIYRTLYREMGYEDDSLKLGLDEMLRDKQHEFDNLMKVKPSQMNRFDMYAGTALAVMGRRDKKLQARLIQHGMNSKMDPHVFDDVREILDHPEWAQRFCDGLDDMGLDDFSDMDDMKVKVEDAFFQDTPSLEALMQEMLDSRPVSGGLTEQSPWKEKRRGL